MKDLVNKFYDLGIMYGLKLIYAIIILLVGFWLCKVIIRWVNKLMEKKDVDITVRPFVKSIISILLKILVVITAASILGVGMSSFVAMIGAAGFAIGMALSGTLQNFAGGIIILILKPFKVGDYIEAQGHSGTVEEIQLFNTYLNTPDNKVIILPNGGLANGSMINYSRKATRRVDFTFGIGYSDDIDKAKASILNVINTHESVLKDPEPFIAVSELADSSVNFAVRVWVKSADYWTVYFYMHEQVKKEFDNNNISIPFPQTDVHLHN
jgi:small conductance mechanosensitive channel